MIMHVKTTITRLHRIKPVIAYNQMLLFTAPYLKMTLFKRQQCDGDLERRLATEQRAITKGWAVTIYTQKTKRTTERGLKKL